MHRKDVPRKASTDRHEVWLAITDEPSGHPREYGFDQVEAIARRIVDRARPSGPAGTTGPSKAVRVIEPTAVVTGAAVRRAGRLLASRHAEAGQGCRSGAVAVAVARKASPVAAATRDPLKVGHTSLVHEGEVTQLIGGTIGSRDGLSTLPGMSLTLNQFKSDRHGLTALEVLSAHLVPTQRLLDLLNDPENEQRMVHAEELDRPPMAGVVHRIEGDAQIVGALGSRTSGKKFRLAVAVAVKMKMLDMGWSTTGRQGPVTNSKYFEKAERFKP